MSKKFLCIQRSAPSGGGGGAPSPDEMKAMWAAFEGWRTKYAANLLDLGGKLGRTGRVVTAAAVSDGPFAESKEVVGGYMLVTAADYDEAVAVVRAMPMLGTSSIEVREIG